MNSLLLSTHLFPLEGMQIPQSHIELMRSYQLSSGGVLNIVMDSIKGVQAVLSIEGKSYEIPFNDIVGIDPVFRFDRAKISQFLEEAYPKVHSRSDGTFSIHMMIGLRGGGLIKKILGGGGKHTSHTQSHSKSAPPPHRTGITYGAGFTIQNLDEIPVAGGVYKEQQGGVGQTKYSSIFESSNDALRPTVVIKIWKRDQYNGEIANLTNLQSKTVLDLTQKQREKSQEEQKKNSTTATVEDTKRKIEAINEQEAQLNLELTKVRSELQLRVSELLKTEETIKQKGSIFYTLKQFLDLNKAKNLSLDTSHPALVQFVSQPILPLIGAKIEEGSFLGSLLSMFQTIIAESDKALGKQVVALVGNTGVGKSTAVNYLLGIKMTKNEAGKIVAVNPTEEKAKIGHRPTTSETEYTQIHASQEGTPFIYADCGGFLDTRGLDTEIAVASSVKFTLEKATGVKLILCFDYPKISLDRGVHFSKFLEDSLEHFVPDYENKKGSILLIVTKTNGASIEEVEEAIKELAQDIDPSKPKLKKLYDFICREEGKYIDVCDPLTEQGRKSIHQKLSTMIPMKGGEVQISYSDRGKLRIVEEMIAVAGTYNELHKGYTNLAAQKKSLQDKEANVTEKQKSLQMQKQSLKQSLSSGVSSLEAIAIRITTLSSQILGLENDQKTRQQRLSQIDNTNYVTYKSSGGSWDVSE